MVVKLSLTSEDERRIERHLSTGRFIDAADLVRQGLQLLEDQERDVEHWLEQDVRPRLADAEGDPERFRASEDIFAELERHHRHRKTASGAA